MTTTYEEYRETQKEFFKKHGFEFETVTSPMDDFGRYHKNYMFADGAVWCEYMSPVCEEVEVEVHLTKVKVKVELQEVEYWSTEHKSNKYYERW